MTALPVVNHSIDLAGSRSEGSAQCAGECVKVCVQDLIYVCGRERENERTREGERRRKKERKRESEL